MTKVFINAKGTVGDITPELKKFLKMVSRHEATDDFTRKLQEIIDFFHMDDNTRDSYMILLLRQGRYLFRRSWRKKSRTSTRGIQKAPCKINWSLTVFTYAEIFRAETIVSALCLKVSGTKSLHTFLIEQSFLLMQ